MVLIVCLCDYGMACMCCLFIEFTGLFCVRCSVMLLSCVWFWCVCFVWCVVLLFVVSLVCRPCMFYCCSVFVCLLFVII